MPKAELHVHLDGCLRLETIVELAGEQGVVLPVPPADAATPSGKAATTPWGQARLRLRGQARFSLAERLRERCVAPDDCRDLMEVLSYFALPVSVLQTPEALERVTYELCEDVRRENVRYIEIRFAPALHRTRGMDLSEVIAAVVRGWQEGRRAFGLAGKPAVRLAGKRAVRLAGGIILCALRHLPPEENLAVARAGLPFLGDGVVGFDLAGDEARFPVLLHREPLLWAKEAGYGMTVHAGEASGAGSVRDAVEVIGVSRVGHGVRSCEDRSLLDTLRQRRITLEMCPTSNMQTKSVRSLAEHPLARYYREGIRVTVNTDNRTVSDTTMTHELLLSHEHMELTVGELAAMMLTALEAGFGEEAERGDLMKVVNEEMRELGI